jgi:hypothetical protein
VNHVHPVNLLNAREDLVEEAASLAFSDSPTCYNMIKELSTTAVLHDEIQLARRLDDFVQLDNVRVLDQFQYVNLPCDSFNIGHVNNPFLLKDLYGHLLSGEYVCPQFHLAEGPLTYGFPKDVVAN